MNCGLDSGGSILRTAAFDFCGCSLGSPTFLMLSCRKGPDIEAAPTSPTPKSFKTPNLNEVLVQRDALHYVPSVMSVQRRAFLSPDRRLRDIVLSVHMDFVLKLLSVKHLPQAEDHLT